MLAIAKSPKFGTMQYLEPEAGRQFIAWINAVNRQLAASGEPLVTCTELGRTRAQQTVYWNAWQTYERAGAPWAALAAVPGTSVHEKYRAADLGQGLAALSDHAHALLVAAAAAYGWKWTGANFTTPEWWHFEYVGGASLIAGAGGSLWAPGITATAANPPTPTPRKDTPDMLLARSKKSDYRYVIGDTEVTTLHDQDAALPYSQAAGHSFVLMNSSQVKILLDHAAKRKTALVSSIAQAVGADVQKAIAEVAAEFAALSASEVSTADPSDAEAADS